jgi:hypothetical protein
MDRPDAVLRQRAAMRSRAVAAQRAVEAVSIPYVDKEFAT